MAHRDDFDITDYIFKVVVLGDSGVGKSSLIRKYVTGSFDYYPTTICVDFYTKNLSLNGKEVKLQIWDTSGEEKWSNILVKSYYRNADGVIYVFDMTKMKTLKNIPDVWIKNVEAGCPDDHVAMLVGSKVDLCEEQDKMMGEQVEVISSLYCLPFVSTSAKNDCNLNKVFVYMAEMLISLRSDYDSLRVPDSLPSFALHSFTPHSPVNEEQDESLSCSSCSY